MKTIATLTILLMASCSGDAQHANVTGERTVGGRCEGPGIRKYWIDEYLFAGNPFLTEEIRRSQQRLGGAGIADARPDRTGMLTAKRDIVLGLNVPGY